MTSMRRSPTAWGHSWGQPLSRDPYSITAQSNTLRGLGNLGTGIDPGTPPEPLGELTSVGWAAVGAGIGWAAVAYSSAEAWGPRHVTAIVGGTAAGVTLLGVRRLLNGDSQGVAPTVLGLAIGAAGFFFAQSRRPAKTASYSSIFD